MTTRRDFIRQATLLGAGLSMSPFFINATPGSVGANDKIRVGLIGCKGMGFSDLQAFLRNPEVECIALCDIDDEVLNSRAAETQKITGKKVKNLYKDWRKLIDNGNAFYPGHTVEQTTHPAGEWVRIYREDDSFVGIYAYDETKEWYKPVKVFPSNTESRK